MIARKIRLFWVAAAPAHHQARSLSAWRTRFRYHRPLRLHSQDSRYDLWMLVPHTGLEERLADLPARSRIAVWGGRRASGLATVAWAREALASQGLTVRSLGVNRPFAPQLDALASDGIEHLLLLPLDGNRAKSRFRAAVRVLSESGAERLGRRRETGAELWRLASVGPRRARSLSTATPPAPSAPAPAAPAAR